IPGVIVLIYLFFKNGRNTVKYFSFLFFPLTLFAIFNVHFFGLGDLLHQFMAYRKLGVNTLGITQVFTDISRAYRWGWYRIFASGVFYFSLSLSFLGCTLANMKKKIGNFNKILSFVLLASLLFVFSVNSVPFLENLGRYLAPTAPLFWVIFYKKLENKKLLYLLIPLSVLAVLI
ncbi:MAG: hypothetical protein NT162_02830, partial [Candidatus Woesebacteria bacterium]|nr:hypothetical protein [Candidatus Woesebacteria bacterium]